MTLKEIFRLILKGGPEEISHGDHYPAPGHFYRG